MRGECGCRFRRGTRRRGSRHRGRESWLKAVTVIDRSDSALGLPGTMTLEMAAGPATLGDAGRDEVGVFLTAASSVSSWDPKNERKWNGGLLGGIGGRDEDRKLLEPGELKVRVPKNTSEIPCGAGDSSAGNPRGRSFGPTTGRNFSKGNGCPALPIRKPQSSMGFPRKPGFGMHRAFLAHCAAAGTFILRCFRSRSSGPRRFPEIPRMRIALAGTEAQGDEGSTGDRQLKRFMTKRRKHAHHDDDQSERRWVVRVFR